MKYCWRNARGATVHDVESGQEIRAVSFVDVDHALVVAYEQPLKIAADGKTAITKAVHFAAIWPIFAGQKAPVMFQCYGRKQ